MAGATRSPLARILAIGLARGAIDAARSHGLLGWPWLLLGHSQAHVPGVAQLAVLFCFEVAYPGLAAARREAGTALLLNLANDSWLATPVLSRQQLAIGAFRAIEGRLPLVRVAHGGSPR